MKEHKSKILLIAQIALAVIISFFVLIQINDLFFYIFLEMNNGIYPQFFPSVVSASSHFVGGFVIGLISLLILFRVNNKEKIILGIIAVNFLFLFVLLYDIEPIVSIHHLRYEVILGGGVFLAIYMFVRKFMASNKSSKSTRDFPQINGH